MHIDVTDKHLICIAQDGHVFNDRTKVTMVEFANRKVSDSANENNLLPRI